MNLELLVRRLREIFADDRVNTAEVMELLESYKSNPREWKKYAVFDEHKYTRNLVDIGNGKYNLMVLCWGPGMGSSIHDHTDSHCFVKMLQGELVETRYAWPEEGEEEEKPLEEITQTLYTTNGVTYMNDSLGLHRMENPSHADGAISLHLYIPPYDHCNAFDQRTGRKTTCQVTFFTKYGSKVDYNSCRTGTLTSAPTYIVPI